jgi:hypothetical protein
MTWPPWPRAKTNHNGQMGVNEALRQLNAPVFHCLLFAGAAPSRTAALVPMGLKQLVLRFRTARNRPDDEAALLAAVALRP